MAFRFDEIQGFPTIGANRETLFVYLYFHQLKSQQKTNNKTTAVTMSGP